MHTRFLFYKNQIFLAEAAYNHILSILFITFIRRRIYTEDELIIYSPHLTFMQRFAA